VYTIFLSAGSLVGGVAGGYIGNQLGWAYIFWVGLALSGACFLGVVFLVPETQYDREAQEPTPETRTTSKEVEVAHTEQVPEQQRYQPYTFVRSLGLGKYQGNVIHHFIQPWRVLPLPGTWVVTLHYAGLVGGVVTIATIGAQLVSSPPYLWGANAGLINIGGLIGVVLGALYTYLVSDALLLQRAKRKRHGFAEPEDRLHTMIPALAIATAGFFVFGFCAQNPGPKRWVGLEVGFGMLTAGLMQVPSIGFNYVSANSAARRFHIQIQADGNLHSSSMHTLISLRIAS
jgi:MFS family permease